ncbi:MAG: hypothetical protein ACRYGL_10610 [Janthinobacterium lividum]
MRKLVMISALLALFGLSACATTLENLAAGAVVGGALVSGTLAGCSRYCY